MPTHHLLLIDDDPTYQVLLAETFSEYQISKACSGKQAIEVLGVCQPDLIILDIRMPDMDGYEVCRAIRDKEHFNATPIVFYSGLNSHEGRLKAYDYGGDDYVCKVGSNKEIRQKVQRLLEDKTEKASIKKDLKAGMSLLQSKQREMSALHLLSQFSQACQFCFSHASLAQVLFNCLNRLGLRGVVFFKSTGDSYSSGKHVTRLENEILQDPESFGRIYSFGENRALFNWDICSLLVKDVGDNLDVLALFMDSLFTGLQTLEKNLIAQSAVKDFEAAFSTAKQHLTEGDGLTFQLKNSLFESGLVSRMDIQDSNDLDKLLNTAREGITRHLAPLENSARGVKRAFKRYQLPPEELAPLFEERGADGEDTDSIEEVLF